MAADEREGGEMMAKHKTLVMLRDDQRERLRVLAFEQRVSMSELLRQIIDGWIETVDQQGKKRKR